jgi:outer membrane protein
MIPSRTAWLAAALLLASSYVGPFAGSLQSRAVAQQPKIAVVDLQRALMEIEEGRKAKGSLKSLFDQRQKTLDKQQEDLRLLKEGIEKQRDVLSREVYAKKVEELQKALAELQTTYMEFQRELAAKEADLTKPILERLQRIVRQVGQKDGYSLVLERNEAGVVYIPSTYDLTDLVIQRYNAGEGGDGAAAKPKATPGPCPARPRSTSARATGCASGPSSAVSALICVFAAACAPSRH